METPLDTQVEDKMLYLTLNQPNTRNALSLAMIESLRHALDDAQQRKDVAGIVVRAEGPVFCPGHDLKEMTSARSNADRGRAFFEETMSLCAEVMQKIVTHPLPIIADVRGVATAAGCQLVASCDLAYATPNASFATPGVNIGLFCSTPMVALSRNVSRKHAMEMLLTGEPITAQRAFEIGLVNAVLPDTEIDTEIDRITSLIASKSASTLKIGKEAFYKQVDMPLAQAYDYCAAVMVENMMEADAKEGITAFLDKRKPNWTE